MTQPTASQVIDKQVTRARRRLISQLLLGHIAVAWTIGLLLTAGWMIAEPYAMTSPPEWLRWTVLGGAVGMLSCVAVFQTIRKSPCELRRHLALDGRFGLRERGRRDQLDALPAFHPGRCCSAHRRANSSQGS